MKPRESTILVVKIKRNDTTRAIGHLVHKGFSSSKKCIKSTYLLAHDQGTLIQGQQHVATGWGYGEKGKITLNGSLSVTA